jgi:hypothetical protein
LEHEACEEHLLRLVAYAIMFSCCMLQKDFLEKSETEHTGFPNRLYEGLKTRNKVFLNWLDRKKEEALVVALRLSVHVLTPESCCSLW